MDVSAEDFAALFAAVSSWGRWGETDERGALHHLTPARVVAAAGLVRDGITVSMSFPVDTAAAAHNPRPATHKITRLPDHNDLGSLGFAMDYVGFDYHSDGEHVFADDLEAAERAQGVTVGEGDILLIRTGHARRLVEYGPWETAGAKAGLHPTAMPFLAERRVAALGPTGTATPRQARPRESRSRSTSLPSTRWASISWTTCRWSSSSCSAAGDPAVEPWLCFGTFTHVED